MRKHLYYDRHAKQIPAALALDARGNLKDGVTLRVPAYFRDAMTPLQREIATKRARITDGTGNCSELAFSRPGWRMLANSVNDARETAYQEYLDYITNAWRTKPPRV